MRTNLLIGLAVLAGLVGAAIPAGAQEVTAEVRTWAGESWRLSQPSLEVFYTIMPPEGKKAERVNTVVNIQATVEDLPKLGEQVVAPKQGHREADVVTLSRQGVEMQIPFARIRSLQFFRHPVENSPLPPYVAATHFRTSAAAELEDGSRVEGDYVNLGTTVLRGMTPEGRVDIPWQEIENVRFGPTEARVAPQAAVVEPPKPGEAVIAEATPLQDVFFDYDRSAIRSDSKAALNQNVQWLEAHPDTKLIVEGHCDERGTNEYNLGLGERRANAVRDYLVAAGIAPGRISTISYGEERPFVLSHDESSWKWNRRAHFGVTK